MFTPNCNNVAFNTKMLKEKKKEKTKGGGRGRNAVWDRETMF